MQLNHLTNLLKQIFGREYFTSKTLSILYGSKKAGRDVDILLLQPFPTLTTAVKIGQLDLSIFCIDNFIELIHLLDPIATEPLLTGDLLIDNFNIWSRLKKEIKTTIPNKMSIAHLYKASTQICLTAQELWQHYCKTNERAYLNWCFQNLSFAISYVSFAKYYSHYAEACTLYELIQKDQVLLPEYWEYYKLLKEKKITLSDKKVEYFFKKWLQRIN